MTSIVCTCGSDPHAVACLVVAASQPHAMVNDAGEVFCPDSPDDAFLFASQHDARMVDPEFRWPDDPAPTTGGPYPSREDLGLPEGCVCYIKEDIDYGDVLTRPPGGCPAHSRGYSLDDLIDTWRPAGPGDTPGQPQLGVHRPSCIDSHCPGCARGRP